MRQSLESKITEASLDAVGGRFTIYEAMVFLCGEVDRLIDRVEELEKQLKGNENEN